jgi:uncharacterized membrane protein
MIKIYIIILVLFLIIDLPVILWLNKDMYSEQFNHINKCYSEDSNILYSIMGGGIAYLLLAFAIYYFIVMPEIENNQKPPASRGDLFIKGMLMGLIIYGIYNGTNIATIKQYSLKVSIIDTCWGALLSGVLAVLSREVYNLL